MGVPARLRGRTYVGGSQEAAFLRNRREVREGNFLSCLFPGSTKEPCSSLKQYSPQLVEGKPRGGAS